mmetsp:Transcript_3210/g.9993  ORF Transcript_3210/g.9993 Transcript_3210/m.9993 type:complete len:147 (-) Transcript_3210:1111-1551(-)
MSVAVALCARVCACVHLLPVVVVAARLWAQVPVSFLCTQTSPPRTACSPSPLCAQNQLESPSDCRKRGVAASLRGVGVGVPASSVSSPLLGPLKPVEKRAQRQVNHKSLPPHLLRFRHETHLDCSSEISLDTDCTASMNTPTLCGS